jgi:GT2 family glycosyltransferase
VATYAIIIPAYNSAATLDALLQSLAQQTFSDFELFFVDDASTDDTPSVLLRHGVRHARMPVNSGPAACRNHGVAQTSAPWLVFTDADTAFLPDTMASLARILRETGADALVGSYAGRPANAGFAPASKALWEYCMIDQMLRLDAQGVAEVGTWAPRPGAIRRAAFDAVGGFDTGFRGADLEDMELGYRLCDAGYRIVLAPGLRIRHHYPATMRRELRAFARRSFLWMRMFSDRKQLDRHGEGSPAQALAHLTGFAAFWGLPAGLLVHPAALGLSGGLLLLYFALNRRVLRQAWQWYGPGFTLAAAAYCWVHTVVLGFAAGGGLLAGRLEKLRHG